jgi:hypothetical protein
MSIDDVAAELEAFNPVRARLWDFSPTHDRCVFELSAGPAGAVKYLVILGCLEIHVPTLWRLEGAVFSRDGDDFLFRDRVAMVRFNLEAHLVDKYAR